MDHVIVIVRHASAILFRTSRLGSWMQQALLGYGGAGVVRYGHRYPAGGSSPEAEGHGGAARVRCPAFRGPLKHQITRYVTNIFAREIKTVIYCKV